MENIFKNAAVLVPKKEKKESTKLKLLYPYFKGREICDIEVEGLDPKDYPRFCDAFIAFANWADTGEPLTDSELEELTESGTCDELIFNSEIDVNIDD